MTITWIRNLRTGVYSDTSRPGFPKGKYQILPGTEPDRYILTTNTQPPTSIMIGNLTECKKCADVCETEQTVLEYEPGLGDLAHLNKNAVNLITQIRRVAISGERLKIILDKKLPNNLIDLEFSILSHAVIQLHDSILSQEKIQ